MSLSIGDMFSISSGSVFTIYNLTNQRVYYEAENDAKSSVLRVVFNAHIEDGLVTLLPKRSYDDEEVL